MKKIATIIAATALLALFAGSAMAAGALRISQVYGGGGATTGTPSYKQDFVEIFNNSGAPINIGGYSLVYGSATGVWDSSSGVGFNGGWTFPANTTIGACKYILVAFTSTTANVLGADLNGIADFNETVSPINMSGTNGKVALVSGTAAAPPGAACGAEGTVGWTVIDKVAFGTGTCFEGAAAVPVLSTTTAAIRKLAGVTDTDSNTADFTVATPTPRTSASPANANCVITPTLHNTWGQLKSIYR